jgi:hypothetical protein
MINLTPSTHPETSVNRSCTRSRYQFIRCVRYRGFCVFKAQQPLVGYGLLILEASYSHTHTHTQHSVGLLWTNDRPVAETYT